MLQQAHLLLALHLLIQLKQLHKHHLFYQMHLAHGLYLVMEIHDGFSQMSIQTIFQSFPKEGWLRQFLYQHLAYLLIQL